MKNTNKTNKTRYGLFYKSHGKWIGPYKKKTITAFTANSNAVKQEVNELKNYVLKSKVEILPVG